MGIEAVGCTRVASRASVLELEEKETCSTTTSSSSSSIGRNSDDDDDEVSSERSMDESGENEVESGYNEGPFHAMEALEEALPIRRGISSFYNGKSKSFTSLADAATTTPSMKDIVKPENAYTRRRRNLMAFNHIWDKNSNRNYPLRSHGGGISKRTMSLSRSAVALAFALSNSESSSSFTSEDSASSNNSNCSYSHSHSTLPPLHPRNRLMSSSSVLSSPSPSSQNLSSWRSFSVADLHHCAIAATMKMSGSSIENETAHHPS